MKIKTEQGVISDPNYWHFSNIKDDGKLDVIGFSNKVRKMANYGVNSWRVLTFLVRDSTGKNPQKDIGHNRYFLPFVFENGKYNLTKLNQIFFDNIKEMIKACNRHNCYFQVVVTDRCHHRMADSPWSLNHQNIKSWYGWSVYMANYVKKLLDTVEEAKNEIEKEGYEFKILFELENEPMVDDFLEHGANVLYEIKQRGYKNNQIEWGLDTWYVNPKTGKFNLIWAEEIKEYVLSKNPRWTKFKNYLRYSFKRDGKHIKLYDVSGEDIDFFYTSHGYVVEIEHIKELIRAVPHTFVYSISNDGHKIKYDKETWYNNVLPVFQEMQRKPNGKKSKDRWSFAAMYNGDISGYSKFDDFIDGVLGITNAYKKVFGVYPENYNIYSETILPPSEGEDMEKIKELEEVIRKQGEEIARLNENLIGLREVINNQNIVIENLKDDDWKFFKGFFDWDFDGLWARFKGWLIAIGILSLPYVFYLLKALFKLIF